MLCNLNSVTHKDSKRIVFDENKLLQINETDFINNCSFIQLENSKNAIFSPDSKIIHKNKNYYIVDRLGKKSILQFDGFGNYIKSIGRYGNGPGEYTTMTDALVSSNGIEILSGNNNTIYYYSSEGDFKLAKQTLKASGIAFFKNEQSNLYYFHLGRNQMDDHELLIYDNNKNSIKDKLFPFKIHFPVQRNVFNSCNSEYSAIYWKPFDPNIYEIKDGKASLLYTIEFKINMFDPDNIKRPDGLMSNFKLYESKIFEKGEYEIIQVLINKNYMYAFIFHYLPNNSGVNVYHFVYDRISNKSMVIGFNNDVLMSLYPAFELDENNNLRFLIQPKLLAGSSDWKNVALNRFDMEGNDIIVTWNIKNDEK